MSSTLTRRALYVLPVLALAACAQAGATPRAAQPSSDRQSYQEATGPEATLRNAFVAAGVVFDDNSRSFEGVTVDAFAKVEPDKCFVDDTGQAGACGDSGNTPVFVAWNSGAFGAATSDGAGGCLYIRYSGGDRVQYGSGSECTGSAALKASADTWGQAASPSG